MSEPIKPLDLDFNDLDRFSGDLSEDELYAPADVSEIPVASLSVPTLTNSPGCTPSASARPIRRARSVQVDAWSAPAPANWGRSRRTVRKVQGRAAAARGVRATPSADWKLPF